MAYFRSNVSGGIPAGVKNLPTVDTASGSVATFDTDLTENLVEVKCQIVAKQASGTPSPVNPLPIGVYDSLTLYHNDINMWDEITELGSFNDTTGEEWNITTTIRSKHYIAVKAGEQYRFVIEGTDTFCKFVFYDNAKNILSVVVGTYHNQSVITIPSGCYYIRFSVGSIYGTTYNNDISINYPFTDTQYHAFNGAYIPFGQTVANGVLDITTGKLRVTRGYYLADGSENFTMGTVPDRFRYFDMSMVSPLNANEWDTNTVSNIFSKQGVSYPYCQINASKKLRFVFSIDDISVTSVADLQALLTNTNAQIIYPLETPYDIQLDSTQITALLNENNIWCDTNGDTSVKYILSVGKAIS